eukprot:539584-Rhodomonas_salina.5
MRDCCFVVDGQLLMPFAIGGAALVSKFDGMQCPLKPEALPGCLATCTHFINSLERVCARRLRGATAALACFGLHAARKGTRRLAFEMLCAKRKRGPFLELLQYK